MGAVCLDSLPPGIGFAGEARIDLDFPVWIIVGVAVLKPIGKNLIENRTVQPRNFGVIRQNLEIIGHHRYEFAHSGCIEPPDFPFCLNRKAVSYLWLVYQQFGFPNVHLVSSFHQPHGLQLLFTVGDAAQNDLIRLPSKRHLQSNRDPLSQPWTGVRNVISCAGMQTMADPIGSLALNLRCLSNFHQR